MVDYFVLDEESVYLSLSRQNVPDDFTPLDASHPRFVFVVPTVGLVEASMV